MPPLNWIEAKRGDKEEEMTSDSTAYQRMIYAHEDLKKRLLAWAEAVEKAKMLMHFRDVREAEIVLEDIAREMREEAK